MCTSELLHAMGFDFISRPQTSPMSARIPGPAGPASPSSSAAGSERLTPTSPTVSMAPSPRLGVTSPMNLSTNQNAPSSSSSSFMIADIVDVQSVDDDRSGRELDLRSPRSEDGPRSLSPMLPFSIENILKPDFGVGKGGKAAHW